MADVNLGSKLLTGTPIAERPPELSKKITVGVDPLDPKQSKPAFMKVHSIVQTATQARGFFDEGDHTDLAKAGLNESQVRLIRDSIFGRESLGYLTPTEKEKFKENGMEELSNLFKWKSPLSNFGVKYVGVAGVMGWSRLVIHNPVEFDGVFPNDNSKVYGGSLVLGLGRLHRNDIPDLSDWDRVWGKFAAYAGEIQISIYGGNTSEDIRVPEDLKQDLVNQVEEEAQEEVDRIEKELQKEADNVEEGLQDDFNSNIKLDNNVKLGDVELNDIDLENLRIKRDAKFISGFLHYKFQIFPGLATTSTPLPGYGLFSFFNTHIRVGAGFMKTDTRIELGGEVKHKSKTDFLGRAALEWDIVRYHGKDIIWNLQTGLGMTAGQQGGPELLLGFGIYHRLGQ